MLLLFSVFMLLLKISEKGLYVCYLSVITDYKSVRHVILMGVLCTVLCKHCYKSKVTEDVIVFTIALCVCGIP